jgi:dTDP-4-dehydrorhamnose 3,5-epimerase
MVVTPTGIPEVLVPGPQASGDERALFYGSSSARNFDRATGLQRDFVQDNHSKSVKGVAVWPVSEVEVFA